jgi:hypothetical protein
MTPGPGPSGPAVAGTKQAREPEQAAGLAVRASPPDPLRQAREGALWWSLLAIGLAGLALVLRPLVAGSSRRGGGRHDGVA